MTPQEEERAAPLTWSLDEFDKAFRPEFLERARIALWLRRADDAAADELGQDILAAFRRWRVNGGSLQEIFTLFADAIERLDHLPTKDR